MNRRQASSLITRTVMKDKSKRTVSAQRAPLQILYMGAVYWDFIRQRPQQLALQLSRRHRVVYVSQLSPLSFIIRRQAPPPRLRVVNDNLTVLHPWIPLLAPPTHRFRVVRAVNQRLVQRAVALRLSGCRVDVLWLGSPWDYGYHQLIESSVTCYDCMDNQPAMVPGWNVGALEEALFGAVDLVFASSTGLLRRAESLAPGAFLVPNGVDFDHFVRAATGRLPAPSDLAEIPRPRIGFYGTLGFWVDLDLITSVAQRRPQWSFVLIGPRFVAAPAVNRLRFLPNVHYLGVKDYAELPAYLQHVDVWWSPFRAGELTQDIDPVKIYEQLAAGATILATRSPETEKFLPLIRVASGTDEFLMKTEAVLSRGIDEDGVLARVSFAHQNTWEQRAATIMETLETTLESKRQRDGASRPAG